MTRLPEFKEMWEHAVEYWPQRADLNPMTMRDEAMLNVILSIMDKCNVSLNRSRFYTERRYIAQFGTPHGSVKLEATTQIALDWLQARLGEGDASP